MWLIVNGNTIMKCLQAADVFFLCLFLRVYQHTDRKMLFTYGTSNKKCVRRLRRTTESEACMCSTVVETNSGSVYHIREIEKYISGGCFHNESVHYESIENLAVGKSLVIRFVDRAAIQTSQIKSLARGTTMLTLE